MAKAEESVQSAQPAVDETDVEVVRGSVVMRASRGGAMVLVIVALVLGVGVLLWGIGTGRSSHVGPLIPGDTESNEIGPESPISVAGKPFQDYTFVVKRTGTYRLDLVTEQAKLYDPFLAVLRGSNSIATDNDGGEGSNSRIVHEFRPGTYTVRVTSYKVSVPSRPIRFHLSATKLSD